jgi:hypothetical protein
VTRDEAKLADLKEHWGEAYAIWHTGTYWYAQHRASRDTVKAATDDRLRLRMRADYQRRTAKPA